MQHFFEPCYESGKAERWKIGLKDEADFAVAGIYQEWDEVEGAKKVTHSPRSPSMPTITR
jgi:putative SOS response-associated peptidase YedK